MKLFNIKSTRSLLTVLIFSIISIGILYINLKANFNYFHNIFSNIQLTTYKLWHLNFKMILKKKLKSRIDLKNLQSAISKAKSNNCVIEQIKADLKPFITQNLSSKSIEELYAKLIKEQNLKANLIKFKITNNHMEVDYVDEIIPYSLSYKVIYEAIEILNDNHLIPDCTFMMYLSDYLNYIPNYVKQPIPILVFAKDIEVPIEKSTILVPDWMNIYYWDMLRSRIGYAKKIYPWTKKEALIHWRGGDMDSLQHRKKLVNLKGKLPFLDVGMTKGKNKVEFLDPEFSLKYKYQLALDGARSTWERVVWQMYSNCLMIKPKSTQVQWFYKGLKANHNYFYLEDISGSDLVEAYNWLVKNDLKVQGIIKNANDFAENNFKLEDFLAYYVLLLQEYAKVIRD